MDGSPEFVWAYILTVGPIVGALALWLWVAGRNR